MSDAPFETAPAPPTALPAGPPGGPSVPPSPAPAEAGRRTAGDGGFEPAAPPTPVPTSAHGDRTADAGAAAEGTAPTPPPTSTLRRIPAAERPRERLAARGPGGLSAAELIAIVWGSGTRGRSAVDVAAEALARLDGLTGLARASDVELEAIPGVGRARAAQLAAAFELGRRLLADWPAGRWTVRAPGDLADRLILQMGRLEQEELRVVLLNAKNAVLRIVTVYVGNVSASLVRIGELFRDAVRTNAAGLIIVHNHPSGDPTPSPDDLHLTSEALAAGRLLDIDVLDHLIIGHDAYVSLRDRGVRFDRGHTRAADG